MDGARSRMQTKSSILTENGNNRRFLIRPKRISDEAMRGYIWRVAELNGFKKPHSLCKIIRLETSVNWSTIDYCQFGQLLGLAYSEIQAQLCDRRAVSESSNFYPQNIRPGTKSANIFPDDKFIRTRRKVCPLCLAETVYHRHIWETAWYVLCDAHCIKLTDACISCETSLDWFSGSLSQCVCGFDLRESPLILVDERVAAFHKLMMKLALHGQSGAKDGAIAELHCLAQVAEELENRYCRPVMHLCREALSTVEKMNFSSNFQQTYQKSPLALSYLERLETAITALPDWPNQFFEDLLPLLAQDHGGQRDSIREASSFEFRM